MTTAMLETATEALQALDVLSRADPACAERAELADLVKYVRRVRGFLDAYDMRIARRGRALAERDRPPATPAPDTPPPRPDRGRDDASLIGMLLSSGVQSGKDAKATGARAGACAELPSFEAALAAGDISGAHVDALARIMRGLTDPERVELRDRESELLNRAKVEFVEGFEKAVRGIVNEIRARHRPQSDAEELERQREASKISTWVDRDTGMHKTLIELDPLRQQEWTLALNAHLARLRSEPSSARTSLQQLKVEAFFAAVRPPGASTGEGIADGTAHHDCVPQRVPKAIVVIDLRTLIGGPHQATIAELSNGSSVPLSTVREMLPDCDLVSVLLSDDGQPLYVGRTRRAATEAQRDALRAIYSHCLRPGCDRTVDDTHAHHTRPWKAGGLTDIDVLAMVCPADHDAIHSGGYDLEVHDNHRSVTWRRPDGSIEYTGPPPGRRRSTA